MSLLQIGFPRSGNFWLYRILDGTLRLAGVERRRFIVDQPVHDEALTWDLGGPERADMDVIDIEASGCHFRIANRFREPIVDLAAYLERSSHTCSHSPWCEATRAVLGRFDHVVYVVRDPRDAIVSLAHYAFTPFMRRAVPPRERNPEEYLRRRHRRLARAWRRHVEGYLAQRDALDLHVVRFEDVVDDFPAELARLLDYLGLSLDGAARAELEREVGFETMRRQAPDHVRRGVVGGWSEALSERQARRIARLAGSPMSALGYERRP